MSSAKDTGRKTGYMELKPAIPTAAQIDAASDGPLGSDTLLEQQRVPIDGFQQVLEMLRIADPAFRESLLKRLAARDRELAAQLRHDLSL